MQSFSDKRIWIIGGSAGIGKALAEAMAKEGASLAISSRDGKTVGEVVNALPGNGKHFALPLDTRDVNALQQALNALVSNWGSIDGIVYAAGIYTAMRADDIKLEEAKKIFEVNFTGCLNVVSVVAPYFLKQKSGMLAMVASVAGYRGLPNSLVYGASKAAMINLTETLYLDLKPHGINVHLICPGFVQTRLTDQNKFKMPGLITAEKAAEEIIKGLKKEIFDIHFPKRFTGFMKMLRILPYPVYFWITKRFTGL